MDRTGGQVSLLRDSSAQSRALMQQSVAYLQAVSATSMAANNSSANFKMIMTARIEGVKSVTELARSAIQKSGGG
jgi:hypothetical protein